MGGWSRARRLAGLGVVALGSLAASCPLGTLCLSPADTYLNLNEDVNATAEHLWVYTWPTQRVANVILLQFDLTNVAEEITQATLGLTLYETRGDPYRISVHAVTGSTPNLAVATGTLRAAATPWTANPCCFNSYPMAQADLGPAAATVDVSQAVPQDVRWDVTALVRGQRRVVTLALNADATAAAEAYRGFRSREYGVVADQPVLALTTGGVPGPAPGPSGAPVVTRRDVLEWRLSWQDNSTDESAFLIERREATGTTWTQVAALGTNATTWTDTAVTWTGRYCWRVKARNAVGDSAWSNEACTP